MYMDFNSIASEKEKLMFALTSSWNNNELQKQETSKKEKLKHDHVNSISFGNGACVGKNTALDANQLSYSNRHPSSQNI